MPVILCVFAHPDDESFGPAGTIARYASQGVPVDLLTFTRGQQGARPEPIDSPEALGVLREYELRAAARVLGVRHLKLLDYEDGQLGEADPAELAGHVLRQLAESKADTIITFGPLGITRHGDHIAVHQATMEAAESAEGPVRIFYQAIERAMAKEMELDLSGPETEPPHRIDITAFAETTLACHSSQQDAREFFTMLVERRPSEELFHQARPPADGRGPRDDLFA